MSSIDQQRYAAVRILEALGYAWRQGEGWVCPLAAPSQKPTLELQAEADALHMVALFRAEMLSGSAQGSAEERELATIGQALEAYEAKRWPERPAATDSV